MISRCTRLRDEQLIAAAEAVARLVSDEEGLARTVASFPHLRADAGNEGGRRAAARGGGGGARGKGERGGAAA